MNSNTRAERRQWAIAVVGGMATGAAVFGLFKLPARPAPEPPRPARAFQLRTVSDTRTLLGEETLMRDLAPLFLPTDRNASLREAPSREPGKPFLDIEAPKLSLGERGGRFDATLPPVVTANGKPVTQATPLDYLAETAGEAIVSGFGRRTPLVAPFAPRGTLEVVRARDGQVVLRHSLPDGVKPPTAKVWQPLEFLANVGAAGLTVPLTVNIPSGVEEVDGFFRDYLARTVRVGDRLAPGFYRITVTP